MNKFTENKLEQAFCELLAQEGYPHSLGDNLLRQPYHCTYYRPYRFGRPTFGAVYKFLNRQRI